MEKISSFRVNHMKLQPGIYISRIDDDIVTYDIRMRRPNSGDYLRNDAIHSIEHMFATYVRNSSFADKIIYFGPMGCRTGFYFLVRNMSHEDAINLIVESFKYIADYYGPIPGASAVECGNYMEHDLHLAKAEARKFLKIITDYPVERLQY
ncbi:MAG TPA: S-ribosylhomocysteine lyase [Clostridiales bacterium]|nr:S-ribosylhomocysteine lyase [Clostridiales bacterium]